MDSTFDSSTEKLTEISKHEDVAVDTQNMGELNDVVEVLARVDLDLAYSSEKLVNLDKLLMQILACENDLEALSLDGDSSSPDVLEKAFVFDLLSGFLDSEVKELESFMHLLQTVIVDSREKISASGSFRELFVVFEYKLHDSEELLKQSQDQVSEIRKQSAKLQRTLLAFKNNDWKYDREAINIIEKPKMQTVQQRRHILRMFEKSLGRELNLEKKLSLFKQNEEDLKLNLHLTEQVALCMEEAAQVTWGRFLEAENASEVLMGTSRELVGRLQIVQFNLNGSMQREDETKWKLHDCMEQLKSREAALQKLESNITELIADNSEVNSLREKVSFLEEQIKISESQLKDANSSNETKEEQLKEMDGIIESLKESTYLAESRGESAEAKITQLTETNVELSEEVNFLKNTNDGNTKKVTLLEKQLRDLDIQLQHAKASSEASQEQQNMLYSAIWDMETLIEELKSKVSKAEIKTDTAEEQCITVSETNAELNSEVRFLRTKIEQLEASLEEAKDTNMSSAKDVNIKTKLIMDMLLQLAMERERIQKQLSTLHEENKVLIRKLQKSEKKAFAPVFPNGVTHQEDFPSRERDGKGAACKDDSEDVVRDSSSKNIQEDESLEHATVCNAGVGFTNGTGNLLVNTEPEREAMTGAPNRSGLNRFSVVMAILILLLSLLALYLFNDQAILSLVEL